MASQALQLCESWKRKGGRSQLLTSRGMVQVIGLCSYVSWCLKWATNLGGLGPLVTFRAIALYGDHLTSAGNSLSPCSVWFPDFALQISHLENFTHPETWCHILQSLGLRARHYFCCCYCCLRFLGKFKVALDSAIKSKSIHVCVCINLIGVLRKKKMCVWVLSFVPPFLALWTVACQAPLSMARIFSRQEYWSGLPFPTLGDLPDPGFQPVSLVSLALACRFFTTSTTWEALRKNTAPLNSSFVVFSPIGFFSALLKMELT